MGVRFSSSGVVGSFLGVGFEGGELGHCYRGGDGGSGECFGS